MNQNDYNILEEIFKNINLYRKTSLALPADKSMSIIVLLTEQIQELYVSLTKHQQKKLGSMIGLMMAALQDQDYVLVRDILVYDMYSFFMSIKPKD